ncbi:MAG TPA: serine/threonine-protein kinase, partial [Vicinamibacterales bacterium]|nr:serine/threonine-protein kinase [Vicinamibacterales bacterium]
MSTTYFRQIGPYEIHRAIGHGGMGQVFLAQDTRPGGLLVALKIVPDGPGADDHETAVAEQRGAELQRSFLPASPFVPRVHELGHADGYLYIAMEYVEGEDLSAAIRRGPMDPRRAVGIAIQLCQFLEEVDRLDSETQGSSPLTLLHNDLKPDNVRLTPDDRVKVLDFGAAKSLSLTRRVTRNQFYSTPYLSPECLDSGERDRQTDAWAVGAILYEMVAGRPAFRASNTRQLERLISSRRSPEPPDEAPLPLQAIVAKLLAPYPHDRYASATAIREDLERFLQNVPTLAEAEAWPARISDEPPTRRVREPRADEPVTRPVARPGATDDSRIDSNATRDLAPAPAPASRWQPARRRLLAIAAGLVFVLLLNESFVNLRARRLAAGVPTQEFAQLAETWTHYDGLARWSLLYGLGLRPLEEALAAQSLTLADRVVESYRMSASTVWSAQWSAAATALARASRVAPSDSRLRGTLRYAEGHLHRIDGEARQKERQTAQAQQEFAAAVAAFREAAALRPNWPDPFLGLARTFIYGIEDIDRGADAMNQAEKLGHTLGPRETAQLAYGYAARGTTLERGAGALDGLP